MPPRKPRRTKHASADALDAHEAAWMLGSHVETLRRLARRGDVPAYKMGKDWRFSKQALHGWMETHHLRQRDRLVLVVDDERDVCRMFGLFLERDGYRVAVAADGKEAIEAAQREMPDVVLLDLVMPGMSGVEVLKRLHAMDRELPVIIVTGHPDSALLTEALRYPPMTLLQKPVDREVLLGTIRRVLHGARRED
jgi:excisionase family DNA binding protein